MTALVNDAHSLLNILQHLTLLLHTPWPAFHQHVLPVFCASFNVSRSCRMHYAA